MNKTELKAKWGHYTDTDKLVDDICTLLTTYRHRNSETGVCKLLDKYFTNKEPLIKMFKTSEHYVGDMRIVLQKEFERGIDSHEIRNFCVKFVSNVEAKEHFITNKDESNKTLFEYFKTGVKLYDIHDFANDSVAAKIKSLHEHLSKFDGNGMFIPSQKKLEIFNAYVDHFSGITTSTISASQKDYLDKVGDVKLAAGMKTSRAFNRVCTEYGVSTLPKYNSLFASYADMVSGLARTLNFVISVNPYDYLTMSFGNSWASCHTIDKTNIRGMANNYSGAYCGGTLSYMLDGSSIITFAADKHADIQTAGKIYRNMFHFQHNIMIQGRIYPQGNDGATDLYTKFREIVQAEMAQMLGLKENKWTIAKGTNNCNRYSNSYGVHYRDYLYNSECNACYPTERKDEIDTVTIGSTGICVNCGASISSSGSLSHTRC